MTTEIIVNAHCSDEKEVKIAISGGGETDTITLQDGESLDNILVYDDREVNVKEVLKSDT